MEVCDWISKPNLSFDWSEFFKYYDYRIVRAPNRLAPPASCALLAVVQATFSLKHYYEHNFVINIKCVASIGYLINFVQIDRYLLDFHQNPVMVQLVKTVQI